MHREIDIDSWPRKTTYEFFRDYADPYFNIAAHVDVTRLYAHCKREELRFSIAALYCSISAANEVPELRLRFVDQKIVEFDRVEATQTILNEDNTFSFCYFPWCDSLDEFVRSGIEARKKYADLKTFDVESGRLDLVYYSVIPWVSFTSFKHANPGDNRQSVPRMVFGKIYETGGARKMPFSVEVHHALADGYHVGKYYEIFQSKLDAF